MGKEKYESTHIYISERTSKHGQRQPMSIATICSVFIQRGYERVGLVPGGFAACEEIVKGSSALRSLLIENENVSTRAEKNNENPPF